MTDGQKFGPTDGERYYQPAKYHNSLPKKCKVKKRSRCDVGEIKTHWILNQSEQYNVFIIGDKLNVGITRGLLFSLLDDCHVELGYRGERLALFCGTSEIWHGYPIKSSETKLLMEDIQLLFEKQAISKTTYSRLLRRTI